jgi:aldose 1-epimerase
MGDLAVRRAWVARTEGTALLLTSRMDDTGTVITLHADRARASIAPGIGGSITHFHWGDGPRRHDWLRPATAADLAARTADRLASFPLVPFSNRVRAGRFTFGGHAVALPLNVWPQPHAEHGHGWQAAWSVVAHAANGLTLEYDHPADPWPFPYRARQEFLLTGDELRLTLSIENRGRETMPVGLGFHPYFPRTAECRLSARVDAMWATDTEVMPTALVDADPRLRHEDGLPIAGTVLDNAFTGWRRQATIFWPETRARLRLDASPPLGFLVVYSPAGEDFFCAEPVSHCTDAFNLAAQGRADTGMLTLQPGANLSATVRFRPNLE